MIDIANSANLIVIVSTAILNVTLIIGFIFKTAKDKTNMENNIQMNTKNISDLKIVHTQGTAELFKKIDRTNELLTELNMNIKVFEERQINQGKLIDMHAKELEHIKDQIRAN